MHREHRFYSRGKIPLEVLIQTADSHRCAGRVRNLGMNGAFVEVNGALPISAGDVELIFNFTAPPLAGPHQMRARITRISDDGVALQFLDYDNQCYLALTQMLYGAKSA